MSDHRWTEAAACKPEDLDKFYPIGLSGRSGDPARDQPAKDICARCDIRELCLTKALEEESGQQRWGIRGGLTADERYALVRGAVA
jgi:WhiB family redox-sensing transcriptional regulator